MSAMEIEQLAESNFAIIATAVVSDFFLHGL